MAFAFILLQIFDAVIILDIFIAHVVFHKNPKQPENIISSML